MNVWSAAAPEMPPAQGLAGPLAELGRKPAKALLTIVVGAAAVAAGCTAAGAPAGAVIFGSLSALWLAAFVASRRTYSAVGTGWVYARTGLTGPGKWASVADLSRVQVRTGGASAPWLCLVAVQGRTLRFQTNRSDRQAALRRELARQVLAGTADIDPDARHYLQQWADPATAVPAGVPAPVRVTSDGRVKWRRGTVQAAVGCAALMLLFAPAAFWHGLQPVLMHHDSHAVRVVATVDRVERDCGKGGCHWWSYGSYDIGGVHESGVAVANERSSPARGPQTILVDPARPRNVINVHESRTIYLALGVGSFLVGALFVGLLARGHRNDLRAAAAQRTAEGAAAGP